MNKKLCIILLALGLITHFLYFGTPNSAVFDEVHFGKFLSAYFTHQYYFDIHPPLGKLILAGCGWLWGFQPGFSFANIGEIYPDKLYMALRFLPTLAGALLPLVVYLLARKLKLSPMASLLAGVLVALDNALLVQSRFILLDSFLLLFGFTAILCYLHWRSGRSLLFLIAAGLLAGMAMSIKWTGGTFLGLIGILECIRLWSARHEHFWRHLLRAFVILVALPLTLYVSVFAVHFALLTKPGPGDAFMNPNFQSEPLLQKTIELNVQMYKTNQGLTASHPYSSKWYTWPLMQRPIFYWVQSAARIYFIGNPLVWWLSTVAVLVVLINIILGGLRRAPPILLFLSGGWIINMIPFIGISRIMFLYHYLTALVWAILMLAYLLDHSQNVKRNALILIGGALVLFIFFAPLSYGLSLSNAAYSARTWLSSWR